MRPPDLEDWTARWFSATGRPAVLMCWAGRHTSKPLESADVAMAVQAVASMPGPIDVVCSGTGGDVVAAVALTEALIRKEYRCFPTSDLRSAHSLLALGATETYLGNFNIGPIDPQMVGKDGSHFSLSDLNASCEYLRLIGQEDSIPAFLGSFFSTFHPVSFARLCRTYRYISSFIQGLLEGRSNELHECLSVLLGGDRPHGVAIETGECMRLMPFCRGMRPTELTLLLEELETFEGLGVSTTKGFSSWS